MLKQPLVSIITPCYNSGKYIEETIKSVLNQIYTNWELLIVDDLSTDNSYNIAKSYAKTDSRIKVFRLTEKGGASIARNFAINRSAGKYVAFLDADDLWNQDKLVEQISFMEKNGYDFTYHYYQTISENGNSTGLLRLAPKQISFRRMLFGCSLGCLSVVYNQEKIGKVQIRKLDKRNDDAIWLTILKNNIIGHLLPMDLAKYRTGNSSLSSGSKIKLLKYHYLLYKTALDYGNIRAVFFSCLNIIAYFYNKIRYVKKIENS